MYLHCYITQCLNSILSLQLLHCAVRPTAHFLIMGICNNLQTVVREMRFFTPKESRRMSSFSRLYQHPQCYCLSSCNQDEITGEMN